MIEFQLGCVCIMLLTITVILIAILAELRRKP